MKQRETDYGRKLIGKGVLCVDFKVPSSLEDQKDKECQISGLATALALLLVSVWILVTQQQLLFSERLGGHSASILIFNEIDWSTMLYRQMTDILECNFMFSMQPMEIFKNRFDMIMPGVLVIAQTVQF